MGGASTEIGDGTTAVLLEAAHWEPTGVARTARRHRLPSEAAKRFERGVDPEMTVVALARAAELLAEYGGARVVGGLVDVDTRGPRPTIALDAAKPARVAGVPYTAGPGGRAARRGRLRRRRRAATRSPVTPPSWRPDLTDPADLVEEVVRLAGYDDIPSVLPTAPPGPRAHRRAAPPAQRRPDAGRGRVRRGAVLPVRRDGRRSTRSAWPTDDPRRQVVAGPQPAVGGGAGAADDAAARPARDAGPQPLPRAARPRAVRARGGLPRRARARRRRCPASTAVRTTRRSPRCSARCPAQPWHVAVALAGNREPRGWWGPGRPADWADAVQAARLVAAAAGRRADRAGGGAGALAPRPLRRAARRRPGGRPRR